MTRTVAVRLITLSVFAFAAVAPASALAQPAHPNYVGAGKVVNTGSTEPSEVLLPRHIAVDPESGRVLVSDSGHGRIATYLPEAGALNFQEAFGSGVLSTPYGLAIDSNRHFVYVSDPGSGRIVRFTYTPGPTAAYTVDSSYVSPGLGSGVGQLGSFKVGLAVDPTTGDLLVADTVNKRVSRFSPTGAFVDSFNGGEATGGSFVGPRDLAVGPTGEVVVADSPGPLVLGRVERFSGDGGWIDNPPVKRLPISVGINQATGMLSVAESPKTAQAGGGIIQSFIDGEAAGEVSLQFGLRPTGVAIDPRVAGQLYTVINDQENSSFGNDGVEAFSPVQAPGTSVLPATNIATESADLSGTVDAGGVLTSAHFEYSVDGINWTRLPELEPIEGSGEVEVHSHLEGLEPNRQYLVRLVATNESTESTSSPNTFVTAASRPAVETLSASGIDGSGATLNGRVTAFGALTTYYFEYGDTSLYGEKAPAGPEGLAGVGRAGVGVSRTIEGLVAGRTYHFRLVATNAAGVTYGGDLTFIAGAGSGTLRRYEQVSPTEKEGQTLNLTQNFQASADGNSASFVVGNASPGAITAPATVHLLATRSATGWGTLAIDPPATTNFTLEAADVLTGNLSTDLQHSFVLSNQVLAPGAVAERHNLYIRNSQTGTYGFVTQLPVEEVILFLHGQGSFLYGASEDWGKVVFTAATALAPGGLNRSTMLYQYSAGDLRVVSRLPDGTPVAIGGGAVRNMSTDGSRLAFAASPAVGGGVYLRESEVTSAVSVSQRSGDPSTVQPGRYLGSSSDGRYLFFQSLNEAPLTLDAPEEGGDIYRFDADTHSLLYLSGTGGSSSQALAVEGASPVSSDGSTLIYTATVGGSVGVFGWRDGVSRLLIPRFEREGLKGRTENAPTMALSENGRWLVLDSVEPITGQSPLNPSACSIGPTNYGLHGDCPQVFRVDTVAARVRCVSCAPDGSAPAGISSIGTAPLGQHEDRPVDNDGDVFFDTPNSLVTGDNNGAEDVYEFSADSARLISAAAPGHESFFADASAGGNDVFFFTDEQLVGQDRDAYMDVYDARRGGGIPSQNPVSAGPPCFGEACRDVGSGPPAVPSVGSETVKGGRHKAHHRSCGKGRGRAKACSKHGKHHGRGQHRTHRGNHNRRQGK